MGYSPPLTGDATSTAATPTVTSLVGTANVESIIRANPLNQFAAATGNYPMGGFYLTGLGQGVVSSHSAQLGQLAGNQMPYVVSGCVWSSDTGSTLAASMTSGTVMIAGILLTVAAVTSRTFTASVDTYVDFQDNGDGTAVILYTTVGNNADSPVLANSGTALNTIRCAIITSTGTAVPTNNVNQGSPKFGTPPTTAQTTTVAAGSNGNVITTSTLSVAANTLPAAGQAIVDTSKGTGVHFGTIIRYTSGGGTTTLSGITVLTQPITGTVSTGGAVTARSQCTVSDSIGNRIFPCSPYPGMLSYRQFVNTVTTTSVGSQSIADLTGTFVIPPGPSRLVKLIGHISFIGSSAVAGTQIQSQLAIDAGTVASAYGNVAVASDGVPFHPEGVGLVTPGMHTFTVNVAQAAAGTLTVGITYLLTAAYVELV